jgi:hypothetical protein
MMSNSNVRKPGKFPKRPATMRAEVLAVLLASEDMTGFESIFEHRKTSLNTVIRALMRKYGWPIERRDFPTNTGDGRSAWASVYCLQQEVIDVALDAGGRDWLDGVIAARAARLRRAVHR